MRSTRKAFTVVAAIATGALALAGGTMVGVAHAHAAQPASLSAPYSPGDVVPIHLSYALAATSVAQLADQAQVVAVGTVRDVNREFARDGIPFTDFDFTVNTWGSKSPATKSIVVRQTGGPLNGYRYEVDDDPLFVVGDSYVLFLREAEQEPGIYFVVAGPSGRFHDQAGTVAPLATGQVATGLPASVNDLVTQATTSMGVARADVTTK